MRPRVRRQTHEREERAHEERSERERATRFSQLLHPDVHVFVGAVDVAVVDQPAHEQVAHATEYLVHPIAARTGHRERTEVVALASSSSSRERMCVMRPRPRAARLVAQSVSSAARASRLSSALAAAMMLSVLRAHDEQALLFEHRLQVALVGSGEG